MKKLFRTLYNRFVSKTPSVFAWLRNVCLAVSGASGAVLAMPSYYPQLLVTYATYGMTLGLVASFLSQFASFKEPKEPPANL